MLSTTFLSIFAVLGAASARIVGVAVPAEIAPGSNFSITIITENYIQSVLDVSAAFGLTQTVYPDSLGTYLTSKYLGPANSNIITNITVAASLPSRYALGSGHHLTAAITSLYGAASEAIMVLYSVPFTVANSTSSELALDTNGVDSSFASSPSSMTTPTASSASATTTVSPISDSTSGAGAVTPGDLSKIIQGVQTGLNSLINDIVRKDTATAQDDYDTISDFLGEIFLLVAPEGSCSDTTTGHTLTVNEAIQTIQAVQLTLNKVELDVINSDSAAAFTDACALLANYYNGGLHEFVFGDGQASGTGQ